MTNVCSVGYGSSADEGEILTMLIDDAYDWTLLGLVRCVNVNMARRWLAV